MHILENITNEGRGLNRSCWRFQVGLDAAGKTTILYKLKLGEIVTTIPTIGTFSIFSGNLGRIICL